MNPETPQTQPQPAPVAPTETLQTPTVWPGAFKIYKHSKQAVKLNLEAILGSILLAFAINLGGSLLSEILFKDLPIADLILNIMVAAVGFVLGGVGTWAYIAGVRGQHVSFKESLAKIEPIWLDLIIINILVSLSYLLSIVLLIIPFFFVLPRLALAVYYLIDKDLKPVDAYKASWYGVKGHSLKIYGIIGANIAMALLMLTIIGIPFSIYFLFMYGAATAVLYEFINRQSVATTNPPV